MRVLLVEDDVALSEAVCGYLRAKAFVVDAVPSLAAAGGALCGAQYAAVLLDLHLPDCTGEDVLAEVKSSWCCLDAETLRPSRLASNVVERFFPKD